VLTNPELLTAIEQLREHLQAHITREEARIVQDFTPGVTTLDEVAHQMGRAKGLREALPLLRETVRALK